MRIQFHRIQYFRFGVRVFYCRIRVSPTRVRARVRVFAESGFSSGPGPSPSPVRVSKYAILNELKCENVVKVEGFCSQPLAVMLEYPYFDFKPLCTQYLFRAGTLLLKLYLLQSFFEVKPVDQLNLH